MADAAEHADTLHALVMELVEGPTLADRLNHGRLEWPDALALARELASALEAAHDKGVVHRDLKPANIKFSSSGSLKLLDFGLAKEHAEHEPAGAPSSQQPTDALKTTDGWVFGTCAYMSPEQARGLPVDKRTDIWAFGCLLFEILTGRRAFDGETVSETVAAVLEREPDWAALPKATPHTVRRLLRRCLEKDPHRRLHDIADARIEIDDALQAKDQAARPSGGPRVRQQFVKLALCEYSDECAMSRDGMGMATAYSREGGELCGATESVNLAQPVHQWVPTGVNVSTISKSLILNG